MVSRKRAVAAGARRGDAMTDENAPNPTEARHSTQGGSPQPCVCAQDDRAESATAPDAKPAGEGGEGNVVRPILDQRGPRPSAPLSRPHPLHPFFDAGGGRHAVAAIIALIIANTPAHEPFLEFWHTYVVVGFGDMVGAMSLAHIISDIFMAVFFLLVGLEIKYEMTVGELTNIRQAALPIIAAFGGVVVMPIVIYSAFNAGDPSAAQGWGVPTATDIAFALGIMALLGNRVPNGIRVFLSTLAVADDIIAILVIAVFYGQSPSFSGSRWRRRSSWRCW